MYCAISGEIPKEPVVSAQSGHVFEKNLIVNYISTSGKDPINDEPLTVDDLIPLQTSSSSSFVPPRPPTFHSIPSLLSTFQNEWDALALEVFTLRKQLHTAKQELSAALYHHDAAVRVAAKAIRERDEAQSALQQLSVSIGKDEPFTEPNGTALQAVNKSPSEEPINKLPSEELAHAREELFQLHKFQKPTLPITPESNVTIEFVQNHLQPFKKSNVSHLAAESKLLAVGSPTGSVAIYNFTDPGKKNVTKITHKGVVTALSFVAEDASGSLVPIVAYEGASVIVNGKDTLSHPHSKDILQIITHPKLSQYFILVSKDNTWSLNTASQSLFHSPKAPSDITSAAIHVDGVLFAVGDKEGKITIYDLTTGAQASTVTVPSADTGRTISHITFALNGYWLLVLSADESSGVLDIIDLRKNTVIHSITSDKEKITNFVIDPSSSLILTCDSSNTFKLHRYIKKGKKWVDNVCDKSADESKGHIVSLSVLSDASDESFKNDGLVTLVGVSDNSSVLEYKFKYD